MDHAISLHFSKDLSPEEKPWDHQSQKANIFLPSLRLPENHCSKKLLLQPKQNFLPVISSSQLYSQAAHMAQELFYYLMAAVG